MDAPLIGVTIAQLLVNEVFDKHLALRRGQLTRQRNDKLTVRTAVNAFKLVGGGVAQAQA